MHYYQSKQTSKLVYFAGSQEPGQRVEDEIDAYIAKKTTSLFGCIPIRDDESAIQLLQEASSQLSNAPFKLKLWPLQIEVRAPQDFGGKTLQQIVFQYLPTTSERGTAIKSDQIPEVIDGVIHKLKDRMEGK